MPCCGSRRLTHEKKALVETQITTPRGSIILRPGHEADAQAYRELRLQALQNHPEAYSSDLKANKQKPMTHWEERLRSLGAENMIFFALSGDRLIGMCGIYRGNSPKTHHSATVVSVYVQPEWRGLQIAEGLINQCIEWARAQEIKILKLAVVTTNSAAIRCYARCGFKVYGIEPQAILNDGIAYDELMMARTI
jgi:RimJ/RimL family protein N-acetyltransferase